MYVICIDVEIARLYEATNVSTIEEESLIDESSVQVPHPKRNFAVTFGRWFPTKRKKKIYNRGANKYFPKKGNQRPPKSAHDWCPRYINSVC